MSGESLQSTSEGEPSCNFCPDPTGTRPHALERSHYDRTIPFVRQDSTCREVNQFFLDYDIAEQDPNCQLALAFNYICGCEGPGYVGANTKAKRKALVWAPRASSILSLIGSASIIVDVVRDKHRRRRPYGQLMAAMSIFDLMGSAAYSLSSLPIPTSTCSMYYGRGSCPHEGSSKILSSGA